MSTEQDLEQIEISIDEAKAAIARMDALVRLRENADFLLLIEEGLFAEEAKRLVLAKSNPQLQDELNQKLLDQKITMIGHFRQFLQATWNIGQNSKRSLEEHYETHAQLSGLEVMGDA